MDINELAEKISDILEIRESVDISLFSRDHISEWDSLKHIDVIFFLQSYTGVQITVEDLENLNDIVSIHKWIESNAN